MNMKYFYIKFKSRENDKIYYRKVMASYLLNAEAKEYVDYTLNIEAYVEAIYDDSMLLDWILYEEYVSIEEGDDDYEW